MHGSADGSAQRGFVLDAVAREAAGEVEQRLALVHALQGFCDGADGIELAVGVERVVLAVVRDVAAGVVGGSIGAAAFGAGSKALALGAVIDADAVEQRGLVGGEVLVHAERCGHGDQRDEICRLHLLVHVVLRGFHRAVQIVGLHGAEIEEHDDEPVVAQDGLVRMGCLVQQRSGGELAADGGLRLLLYELVDVLEVEGLDALRFAVFEDGEVGGLQSLHHFAGLLIANDDVGEHEFALHLHGIAAGGVRLLRAESRRQRECSTRARLP